MVSVDIKHHERRREYESGMPLTCRTWHSKTLRPKNNRVQKLVVVYRGCRPFCFTFTEARWLSRDGDGGRKRDGSTADTSRKRPERPWTAARTMEVFRRCPLAIAQRLVHRAIAVSTAVLDRVTKTTSVAPLLTNNLDNSKQKTSNLLSPAPPPYS